MKKPGQYDSGLRTDLVKNRRFSFSEIVVFRSARYPKWLPDRFSQFSKGGSQTRTVQLGLRETLSAPMRDEQDMMKSSCSI